MVYIRDLGAWAGIKLKVEKPGVAEPDTEVVTGVVRVKNPTWLNNTLLVLLGGMLPALLLILLSFGEPMNLGDADFGTK